MVLAAAVLEVVAPIVTANGPGSSPGEGAGPELLITPVGWAFSIWGVIYTLAIAQAIAVLVVGSAAIPGRLQIDLIALYIGGAVWIVLAGLDSTLATAGALLWMLIAGVDAVLTVAREPITPRWLSILTRAAVGLYAGWVTAAFFLNASTALVDAGPFEADELPWQLVMLALAVVTLLVLLIKTGGIPTYAAAGTWAMIGITVTGRDNNTDEIVVLAVAAAVILVAAAIALNVRNRKLA
jgi:hypothetical protein